MVSLFVFFFSWCVCHCVLQSFPTRRSSDLVVAQTEHLAIGADRGNALQLELDVSRRAELAPVDRSDELLVEQWGERRDRKSTRLNSSHPSISYAVFCLKK